MIGAKELILASVDSASVIDEHEEADAALRAAGLDPISTSQYAEFAAQNFPNHLAQMVENGQSYQRALIACFAAAYLEGAMTAARAVRAEENA